VPELADLPAGCPFADRCERADDACRAALPQPVVVVDAHETRCIRAYGSLDAPSD
jgi:peptide/nickel transport system ATP-binding protein